ncbi:MAG: hypothetical protein Solivirus3_12 [Solivirus sp.]|uniref:Uncharacterized protein n=1 Tax=Solivirus sp. TaxID=2487772 RepID=A0A3G5AFR0_9VIRU|nr:MAG: hypothetical protein Solivirus3_12 [Solivirus sp.]
MSEISHSEKSTTKERASLVEEISQTSEYVPNPDSKLLDQLALLPDIKSFSELWLKSYFGEKLPDAERLKREQRFTLTIEISTEPVVLEDPLLRQLEDRLLMRLNSILYSCQMKPAEQIFLSLYAREAGGSVVSKFRPEITHCAVIACNELTQIEAEGKNIVLHHPHNVCAIATEIKRYETEVTKSGRSVVTQHPSPSIKKNHTVLKYYTYRMVPNAGKKPSRVSDLHSKIKQRTYLSLVAWLGWSDNPVQSQQEIEEVRRLEAMEDEVLRMRQEVEETPDDDDE